MKKMVAALLALLAIISLIGCERLPEEPEPSATPRASTPEPKDYYSDTEDDDTSEPEPAEAPEGEGGGEGEDAVETSEESEEEDDESDSTFSYTRRTREEIEAEIMQGVIKDETDTRLGSDLARPYRMIPPSGGWRGTYGGVVWREEPVGEVPVVVAPNPKPTEPAVNIDIRVNGTTYTDIAYVDDGVQMIPLDGGPDGDKFQSLFNSITGSGNRRVINRNGNAAVLDIMSGTVYFKNQTYSLSTHPNSIGEILYVPIDFFSIFEDIDIIISADGNLVTIGPDTRRIIVIPSPDPNNNDKESIGGDEGGGEEL